MVSLKMAQDVMSREKDEGFLKEVGNRSGFFSYYQYGGT